MTKFSYFKNSNSKTEDGSLTLAQLLEGIKEGTWKKLVLKVRSQSGTKFYRQLKETLPAVSISGEFKKRDKLIPVEKRLRHHSGHICIDVDKKDNPKLRTKDLVDNECLAQHISAGGEGIKIIYNCKPVTTAAEHRRIYDACIERLAKKNIQIKADPVVKSIASLQYVSYDPQLFYNPKTKLVIKPLPPIVRKAQKSTPTQEGLLAQLDDYIAALGKVDITKTYEDWLTVMFGLSYSLGEAGRKPMHAICSNYKDYSEAECDEKYDGCLDAAPAENPVTISSVFSMINEAIPKAKRKELGAKYNPTHAIGEGTESEHPDLLGYVQFGLFLFKKVIDKETRQIIELRHEKLNLNAFEKLLRDLGFYRYLFNVDRNYFVRIVENIVSTVDVADILRIVTEHIEACGGYRFSYKDTEYEFTAEELAIKFRELRAQSTMYTQITASLTHWNPNLLKDNVNESFIPYRNGVVRVTASEIKLIPYAQIPYQVWKERILPRDYRYERNRGMFEDFFINVMGRGKTTKEKLRSPTLKKALWYFGYMLQGTKRQSTARAWILYDIKTGNNGRSGKTIVANAVGKIRNLVIIDGKRTDLNDRFAFQTIEPWTDVVLIDDVAQRASLQPLFNMITGTAIADRKGILPIQRDLKFMLTSNWFLESSGNSESGRQYVNQLDDFYVRYGKENGDSITPIVDYHGKEFFTDWDRLDWNKFDSFCLRALQTHLKEAAPANSIIGEARLLRFIQMYEEELFIDLSIYLLQNAFRLNGLIAVPQKSFIQALSESMPDVKSKSAGRIVKDYLIAIGGQPTIAVYQPTGASSRAAYTICKSWADLDFGSFGKTLPKGKQI